MENLAEARLENRAKLLRHLKRPQKRSLKFKLYKTVIDLEPEDDGLTIPDYRKTL